MRKSHTTIKEILCPYCQTTILYLRPSPINPRVQEWYCPNGCVYTFPEDWFDVFHQYKKFVTLIIKEEK